MERLTSNIDYCETYCETNKARCPIYSSCINRKSYEKAKEYENAEEQGLLLRLPCPIGTTVFVIIEECEEIYESDNTHFEIYAESFHPYMLDSIGKDVFLTLEEAEQALKQIGE